jgi:hypothetical protein
VTVINTYGGRLPPGSVGDRQVPAIPASKSASPPIQTDRWFRNGKNPDATALSLLNESANQAGLFRSKCVFSSMGRAFLSLPTTGTADRGRFRFAFHTGPLTHSLMAVVIMMPTDLDIAPYEGYNTQSRLDIFTGTTESVVAGSATFTYGVHPTGTNATVGFQHLKVLTQYIAIDPDTDYTGLFSNVLVGRIVGATVFELPSMTENFDGYLNQALTAQTPIVDLDRANIAELIRSLWRRAGCHYLNWTLDDQDAPLTTITTPPVNVIDTSITAVSASSPGYTLVADNRARLSQSAGVPCVMKAFGHMDSGPANGGDVYIKDSAGATVASITSGWTGTTPTWASTSFNLPATTDKYDLQFSTTIGSGEFSLYAISIYHYEA